MSLPVVFCVLRNRSTFYEISNRGWISSWLASFRLTRLKTSFLRRSAHRDRKPLTLGKDGAVSYLNWLWIRMNQVINKTYCPYCPNVQKRRLGNTRSERASTGMRSARVCNETLDWRFAGSGRVLVLNVPHWYKIWWACSNFQDFGGIGFVTLTLVNVHFISSFSASRV